MAFVGAASAECCSCSTLALFEWALANGLVTAAVSAVALCDEPTGTGVGAMRRLAVRCADARTLATRFALGETALFAGFGLRFFGGVGARGSGGGLGGDACVGAVRSAAAAPGHE